MVNFIQHIPTNRKSENHIFSFSSTRSRDENLVPIPCAGKYAPFPALGVEMKIQSPSLVLKNMNYIFMEEKNTFKILQLTY